MEKALKEKYFDKIIENLEKLGFEEGKLDTAIKERSFEVYNLDNNILLLEFAWGGEGNVESIALDFNDDEYEFVSKIYNNSGESEDDIHKTFNDIENLRLFLVSSGYDTISSIIPSKNSIEK